MPQELGFGLWIPDGGFRIRKLQDQPLPVSSCLFQLSFALFVRGSPFKVGLNSFSDQPMRPSEDNVKNISFLILFSVCRNPVNFKGDLACKGGDGSE